MNGSENYAAIENPIKKYLTLKKARANKLQLDWTAYTPPKTGDFRNKGF